MRRAGSARTRPSVPEQLPQLPAPPLKRPAVARSQLRQLAWRGRPPADQFVFRHACPSRPPGAVHAGRRTARRAAGVRRARRRGGGRSTTSSPRRGDAFGVDVRVLRLLSSIGPLFPGGGPVSYLAEVDRAPESTSRPWPGDDPLADAPAPAAVRASPAGTPPTSPGPPRSCASSGIDGDRCAAADPDLEPVQHLAAADRRRRRLAEGRAAVLRPRGRAAAAARSGGRCRRCWARSRAGCCWPSVPGDGPVRGDRRAPCWTWSGMLVRLQTDWIGRDRRACSRSASRTSGRRRCMPRIDARWRSGCGRTDR